MEVPFERIARTQRLFICPVCLPRSLTRFMAVSNLSPHLILMAIGRVGIIMLNLQKWKLRHQWICASFYRKARSPSLALLLPSHGSVSLGALLRQVVF